MSTALPVPELSQIVRMMYPGIQEKVDNRICPQCGEKIDPVDGFRDGLSMKEYMISGLCQSCQDSIFGDDQS